MKVSVGVPCYIPWWRIHQWGFRGSLIVCLFFCRLHDCLQPYSFLESSASLEDSPEGLSLYWNFLSSKCRLDITNEWFHLNLRKEIYPYELRDFDFNEHSWTLGKLALGSRYDFFFRNKKKNLSNYFKTSGVKNITKIPYSIKSSKTLNLRIKIKVYL